MRLYDLDEEIIIDVIKSGEKKIQQTGRIEYTLIIDSFLYPIKVICKEEKNEIIVISCYPLKKGL